MTEPSASASETGHAPRCSPPPRSPERAKRARRRRKTHRQGEVAHIGGTVGPRGRRPDYRALRRAFIGDFSLAGGFFSAWASARRASIRFWRR